MECAKQVEHFFILIWFKRKNAIYLNEGEGDILLDDY